MEVSNTKLRANWIFVETDFCPGLAADYKCSNCGSLTMTRYIRDHKYCHNCGAKMKKEIIRDRRKQD